MGIKVVPRYGKSFKDKLYLPAIAGGMKTTFRHFIKNLKDRLGESVNLKFEYVDVIPLGKNGKFEAVKRKFKLE